MLPEYTVCKMIIFPSDIGQMNVEARDQIKLEETCGLQYVRWLFNQHNSGVVNCLFNVMHMLPNNLYSISLIGS